MARMTDKRHSGALNSCNSLAFKPAVATKIADIPASANGVLTRVAYFQALGGVAYLPEYNSSILFMPTR